MDRNEYRRALIMLRSLKKGYAGHGRIEVRTLTGRLNVLVTAPEGTGLTQQVALVGRRRGEYYAWPLGSLRRDLRGQAGLSVTFDPRDLGGRTLEAYCLMAVAEISGDDCQLALVGNLGGSCEMDWAQVREAVCGLYAPESVTDLPESAEDAPTPAAQEAPAQEETAKAPDPGSAFQFEFQETPEESEAEETPAEEAQPAPEETAPQEEPARETPYCRHGWEFARVTLPAACGFDQLLLSDGGAAGGNQVVNDKDDIAGLDGVGVDLQRIGAVFKLVALRDDLARKLAGLACGNEPCVQLVCNRGADDEAAGLGADNLGDALACEPVGNAVDRCLQGIGVHHKRREVDEDDAGFGIIGDARERG